MGSWQTGGSSSKLSLTRPRERGLSLFELSITVTLLLTVTLGAVLVLVPVVRQSRINREMTVADAEARRVLEQFQALPFNDIVDTYPHNSEISVLTLPNGKIAVSYLDPAVDPLEISLNLTWESSDLGPMAQTFVTVRTQ